MTTEIPSPTAARMVIGGDTVDAAEGRTFDVVNPADGRVMATAPQGGAEDVERAVAAAFGAFGDGQGEWPRTSATERGRVLARVAAILRERAEAIARLENPTVVHTLGA